jgi:hypothetical protein
MQELASLGSFTGFRSLAWDIAALGHYGGFCQQECAMDHKNKVKYFNTLEGQVVRAFTVENILFQDRDQMIVHNPLLHSELIKTVEMCYAVQKNRRNGQVIWFSRDLANPSLCPVVHTQSLVCRAVIFGAVPLRSNLCISRYHQQHGLPHRSHNYQVLLACHEAGLSRHQCSRPSQHFLPFSASYCTCSSCRSWYGSVIASRFIFKTHYGWQTCITLQSQECLLRSHPPT